MIRKKLKHDTIATAITLVLVIPLVVITSALDSFTILVAVWVILLLFVIEMIVYRKLLRRNSNQV